MGQDVKREANIHPLIGYAHNNPLYTAKMDPSYRSVNLLPPILALAIVAISTASIFIRYAQYEGAPSLVIAALRLSIATALLAPVVVKNHLLELRSIKTTQLAYAAGSGIFLAIHFSAWITSLEFTSVASSALFVSTGPLWVAVLSPLLINEKLPTIALAGVGLAMAGGILIALVDGCGEFSIRVCMQEIDFLQNQEVLRGNFLALVGAWAVSGYLMVGRKARASMSLIPYVFLVYGIAALALNAYLALTHVTPWNYSPLAYLWIFLLSAIPQLVGHSTLNWALKFMPASLVSVVTLSEPIGAAILAYFLFQETPNPTSILGGVLILLGIFFAARSSK